MSVSGLNTTAITNAQTAVTNLNTSITSLNAQITLYSAALTTLLNSASANAKLPDVVDAANYIAGIGSQIDALKSQLAIYVGSLAVPT